LAAKGVKLILVPGDDRPDPELSDLSTEPAEDRERLWHYLRQGGKHNALELFNCLASRWLDRDYLWKEPQTLPRTAIYHPRKASAQLEDWRAEWQAGHPVAAVLFYRSHLQAANTGFIDVFCERLAGPRPEPTADCGRQSQRAGLSGGSPGLAGRDRVRGHPQHHRFRPVEPGGAASATVPAQYPGHSGHLRPG
jgi:hypothetical protein